MLHTSSLSTRFLTVRFLFAAVRPAIETRKRKESLSFWQEIPCLGDNPTRALLQVPHRVPQDNLIYALYNDGTDITGIL